MKSRFPASIHLRVALVLCSLLAPAFSAELRPANAQSYLEHVKFLASDELQGRGAGTAGQEQAADYIGEQFRAAGLQPAGDNGSFFQPFTVTTGARMGNRNHFTIHNSQDSRRLDPGADYIPVNFSSDAVVEGPMVFAGYGVSAAEFGYDDYTHFDVKDKIVVVLRYEPSDLGKEQGFGGKRRTYHAHLITKAINARNRGAKAVIVVNGKLDGDEQDTLLKFGAVAGPDDAGILMVHAKNAVVNGWFEAAGKSLEVVQAEITKEQSPQSFAFPATLRVSLEVETAASAYRESPVAR
jgi:hypothetical protein